MRMQFDTTEIYHPGKPSRVIHDDFFCGAAGWEGKSHGPQPRRALLRRTLLVKGRSLSAVYEPLQDDRTIADSGKRARRNRQVVTSKIELRDARLREINLVRMCDVDFASINREQFAGFLLRHENRLTPALPGHVNPLLEECFRRNMETAAES